VVVPVVDFEAYTRSEGEMITVTQPIAKIESVGGKLEVIQIARNNFAQIEACKDGYILKYLNPV
jgi:hypothetical protein